MEPQHILVASAWPYANGSLHLGHVASLIGADVLARYHRLRGDSVLFVSGSDCYGTPIAVEAAALGVTPQSIADRYHAEFEGVFHDLDFSFDLYTKTTTPEHARVVQDLFLRLYERGCIHTKVERALYSPLLDRFLPDRFVEGVCPHCRFDGARGDQCDGCGRLLDPLSLDRPRVNPKILGGASSGDTALEARDSEHFYLKLGSFQKELESFVDRSSGLWRTNAEQITRGFLSRGLHDRAITRDTDWGIPVPLEGYAGKRLYVWFEAVLGYLSASQVCASDSWELWWRSDSSLHYYVHGKDNVPFHTVMLPSILLGAGGLHLPDRVFSSEYLLLEGGKFSTSRGYAVWVSEFLSSFDSDLLRYFLIVQGPETADIDFRWSEFGSLVNGELIGTFGNLVNRVCSFVEKHFPQGVSFPVPDSSAQALLRTAEASFDSVGEHIQCGRFRQAFREVLRVAEQGNRFAHAAEPWKTLADFPGRAEADLAVLLQVIRSLSVLVQPFLPKTSQKMRGFLNFDAGDVWRYPVPFSRCILGNTEVLYAKVTESAVQEQLEKLGVLGEKGA